MLTTLLTFFLAAAPQGGASVVINEFSYDDSGTDDREYVELYNRSTSPVDISGWTLESRDQAGANASYTIPPGTVLAPGDWWVLGSQLVPNVDQIVGTVDLWENDMETLELKDASAALVDSLAYEANKASFSAAGIAEGEGVWGNFTMITGVETSWSRIRDGQDTDDNGDDFRLQPWTPGASNGMPTVERARYDYDVASVGSNPAEWGGSFVLPHVIDPTVADTQNPNAIPASPQGGNAAIFWDNSGGGNSNMLVADGSDATHFECYVYLDATPRPTGEMEMWSIGVGTTGTFFNFPDPTGALGFTANGNTGVAWTWVVNDTGGTLYLIDHNNGGAGTAAATQPVVIGQVTVTPGVDDGWQRLSLTVANGTAAGRFGGTYGAADGTLVSGAASSGLRGIYAGYREFLVNNAATRPLTLDALLVAQCGPATTRAFGNGIPSGAGTTPTLSASALPAQGATLTVAAAGMIPNDSAAWVIGFERVAPITLPGLTPPSFGLWVDGVHFPTLPTDVNGTSSLQLTVPNDPRMCGIDLAFQVFQIDQNLAAPIPVFHTAGLVLHLGQ